MVEYSDLKKLLFIIQPLHAHDFAKKIFELAQKSNLILNKIEDHYRFDDPRIKTYLPARDLSNSVQLNNPVGLAAGFDKDVKLYKIMDAFGFGSIESGSVTAEPFPGNAKPIMYRLVEDLGLINWLGLPGDGAESISADLNRTEHIDKNIIQTINVSKTPNASDEAVDLKKSISYMTKFPFVKSMVVSISCPNTGESIKMQSETLDNKLAVARAETDLPLYVKLSPDLESKAFEYLIELANDQEVDGLVLSNASLRRKEYNLIQNLPEELMHKGGLSGKPVFSEALKAVSHAYNLINDHGYDLGLIHCGGIFTGEDIGLALAAGANSTQGLTGFVYGGPAFAMNAKRGLVSYLDRVECRTAGELIGIAHE